MVHTLKIADFAKYPGGRYKKYGPGSGQEYREDYILPALKDHDLIQFDLTGVYAFAPSFVSEITDIMIREGMITYEEYCRRISFVSDKENHHYIKEMFESYRDECDPATQEAQEARREEVEEGILAEMLDDIQSEQVEPLEPVVFDTTPAPCEKVGFTLQEKAPHAYSGNPGGRKGRKGKRR